jgi:hypothetical protein
MFRKLSYILLGLLTYIAIICFVFLAASVVLIATEGLATDEQANTATSVVQTIAFFAFTLVTIYSAAKLATNFTKPYSKEVISTILIFTVLFSIYTSIAQTMSEKAAPFVINILQGVFTSPSFWAATIAIYAPLISILLQEMKTK